MLLLLQMLRIIFFIILLLLGIPVIIWQYSNAPASFGDFMNFYALYAMLCMSIVIFLIERFLYLRQKKIFRFSGTAVSILFWIVIAIPMTSKSITDEATTKLKASGTASFGQVSFDFKTNNRFRLIEGYGLNGKLYYGSYTIKADTLFIKCPGYADEQHPLPEYGVLRGDTIFWNNGDKMHAEIAH